ncbi:MAG: YCF48-related protein [Bacillota bacterium]
MKQAKNLFLLVLLSMIILLSACQNGQKVANPNVKKPEESSDNKGSWNIAFEAKFDESTFTLSGFSNEKSGILMGHLGTIHTTMDGGKTWQKSESGGHFTYGLDFIDEANALCCGDLGGIFITSNGGKSWKSLPEYDPLDQNPYQFISFADINNGWVASTSKLGHTVDGGQSWTTMKLPEDCKTIAAVQLMTDSVGYILDTAGVLYTTEDCGKTWVKKSLGLGDERIPGLTPAQVAVIRFSDSKNGLVIFYNRDRKLRALRTSDGGDTWKDEMIPQVEYGYVYLTRDSSILSIANPIDKKITVLKYVK